MLYVLDIDDTLYLERDYVRSGFCAIGRWLAENRNVEDFFERAWTLFESDVRGNIFDTVLEDLGIFNLEQYMDRIIVTDDWGKEFWKPNPRAYILAQGKRSPEECVYIADNPLKDFKAPARLSWAPSVRIRRKESFHYAIDTPESCVEVDFLNDGRL